MGGIRVEKVAHALKEEVSKIVHDEVKDPRIGFVTITRVELTNDLRQAKIYFSLLGNQEDSEKALKGLVNTTGYIRKLIGERLRLRFVPQIEFKLDRGIEHSIHIAEILDKLKEDKNNQ